MSSRDQDVRATVYESLGAKRVNSTVADWMHTAVYSVNANESSIVFWASDLRMLSDTTKSVRVKSVRASTCARIMFTWTAHSALTII